MTTIATVLRTARQRLASVSESASGDAQALLCAVLNVERAHLLAHPEQPLTDEQAAAFDALVARCAAGEPLPYVLGRRAWYDREFIVTPDVLIPRPETERLLEQALEWAEQKRGVAVDVGTGSGNLAVTFAALRPDWRVYAVDVSAAALDVARRNAAWHGVAERISFVQGDLLIGWQRSLRIDLLMANLPYIPSADVSTLPVAAHEPRLALDGGEDGLRLIERLLAQARRIIRPGGLILLEIEAQQGAAAAALAQASFPTARVDVLRDYAGLDRIVRTAFAD
jgi:release factor glutamine methyltransferase